MHTISFYSYKGGVGRSMAVYYFAEYLSRIGKKVVVADFDFEAPGLPYKFKVKLSDIKQGMVDYIHAFHTVYEIPASLNDYMVKVPGLGKEENPVWMLPAGVSKDKKYWLKLHEIDWKKLLYTKESYGRAFFLEWQLRLEAEFQPDVLLIDSRTGIHDLTAVTMQLLADQIVILGVNNQENLDGCRLLMEILKDGKVSEFKTSKPNYHFILTRLPEENREFFNSKVEEGIIENIKLILNKDRGIAAGSLVEKITVIHSDERLLMDEHFLRNNHSPHLRPVEKDFLTAVYDVCVESPLLNKVQQEALHLKIFDSPELNKSRKILLSKTNFRLLKQIKADGTFSFYINSVINFAESNYSKDGFSQIEVDPGTGENVISLFVKTNPDQIRIWADTPVVHLVPIGNSVPIPYIVVKVVDDHGTVLCESIVQSDADSVQIGEAADESSRPFPLI